MYDVSCIQPRPLNVISLLIMIRIQSCSRLLHGFKEKVTHGFPASIATAALQRQKLTEDDVNKKIFEFRTYAIRPDKFRECMKIIESNIHIRTAHSKLVGFWITEMGGINEVYHLWEFGKSRHPQDGPCYVVHVHVLNSVTSESLSLSLSLTHTHTHTTQIITSTVLMFVRH